MKRLPSFAEIRVDNRLYWTSQKNLRNAKIKDKALQRYLDKLDKLDPSNTKLIQKAQEKILANNEDITHEKYNIDLLRSYYFNQQIASLG